MQRLHFKLCLQAAKAWDERQNSLERGKETNRLLNRFPYRDRNW